MLERFLNNNTSFTIADAEFLRDSYDNSDKVRCVAAKIRICDLIERDHVTMARWNENRLALIHAYIIHPNGPFRKNPIKDDLFSTEFQTRGTLNFHGNIWTQTAISYVNQSDNSKCVEFIDKYITCEWYDEHSTVVVSESSSEDDEVDKETEGVNRLRKRKKM